MDIKDGYIMRKNGDPRCESKMECRTHGSVWFYKCYNYLCIGLYWIRMLWQIEDSLSNYMSTYQPCSINNRSTNYLKSFYINSIYMYSPFHKTLPRPSASENWISVRFYKTDCIHFFSLHLFTLLTLFTLLNSFTMKGPSNIKL